MQPVMHYVDGPDDPLGTLVELHARAPRLERERFMGIYLEIARKAVKDYRREETERRARERREQISKAEDAILRHYSAKLEGGADNYKSLVEDLASWNPHFTAERDIIEEAVRAAAEKMAESRDLHDTINCPIHQEPGGGPVDQVHTEDHRVERDDAGPGVHEADEPETYTEGFSGKSADPAPHGDAEFGTIQVTRVAEVLRQHRERWTSDADELIEEGFFFDKLDFDPTTGIVEEAQCRLLFYEETTS